MVVLLAVHPSIPVCWAPISLSHGMFETAVVGFQFLQFPLAAVFVYVSFNGIYVLLFALELFQLRRGGFVCSGNVNGFFEGKLFALLQ